MSLLSCVQNALMTAALFAVALPVCGLPVVPADRPEIARGLEVAGEELPPLAVLDVPSLRSWMNHTIGPGLEEERAIDPTAWPLLEFHAPTKLELRLDLPEFP